MNAKVTLTTGAEAERLVAQVRERYGRIARENGSCCGPRASGCGTDAPEAAFELGYDAAELAQVPAEANLGLGCGAPVAALALQPGEVVLDLGSGPGLDVFLAARQVGPAGRAIGVDMTPAMLDKARAAAARLGLANVEFREGRLEALPVADASVDAVTSNCVINLVPDKRAVFAEVARVLRPGGRLVISDIVLEAPLPAALEQDVLAYTGCVAGAARREDYLGWLRAAGLDRIDVLHDVDYLATLERAAPEAVRAVLGRSGVSREEIAGRVRSLTLRAVKPA